jgi:hypothetical protein
MVPNLSEEAWALLGMLHRANNGGPPAPVGFENSYAELQGHGFALGNAITDKGDEVLRERFFSSNPDLFHSKGSKGGHRSGA